MRATSILITGGTGSFGQKCVEYLLNNFDFARIVVYSRDELKQYEMAQRFPAGGTLRYFVGDVRDKERLIRAMKGIDYVIHAAALKQVGACEYNPAEAMKTNVLGTQNVIDACLDAGVSRAIFISTDKACEPVNTYGKCKALAESLWIQANAYSGKEGTKFSAVRYGNVAGSRGSVVPLFKEQAKTGKVTVTDKRMTRFWLTLEQGIELVMDTLGSMRGGEIVIPKIPSVDILNLVLAIAPNCDIEEIGIRPGEKLHEVLISEQEIRQAVDIGKRYIIQPLHPWWTTQSYEGEAVQEKYSSDNNAHWLNSEQILRMLEATK